MLYYDRLDVSGGMDISKTSGSKESGVCHYWYFLNYSFTFQPNVYNRCHDLLVIPMNFRYWNFNGLIRKNEAINLMRNADLTEKYGTL